MRGWERRGTPPWVHHTLAWFVPGLALVRPGRLRAALLWVGTSAAVVAGLLSLALTATVWPVAVLLLLPAWLVVAPLAVRSIARPAPATPSVGWMASLTLLHWTPALVVLALTAPGWFLLRADNPASLPALAPGEIAACRCGRGTSTLARGDLVVAGVAGERFLGRILGLPGERVEPDGDGWLLDGAPAVRAERDLLLPPEDDSTPGTRSLVYRVGDRYLSLWSRGTPEPAPGPGAAAELAAGEVYVLALDHGGGASLDSRSRGAFPLDRVHPAHCVLLWSPQRLARFGRPVL